MKAQILKIAGVKSEKEFYKKFPTEEAFMKAHGKELKKAQMGMGVGKMLNQSLLDAKNMKGANPMFSNSFNPMPSPAPAPSPQFIDPQSVGGMQNLNIAKTMSYGKPSEGDYFSSFKTPGNTPANPVPSPNVEVKKTNFEKIAGPAGKIVDDIQAIKEEKKALKRAEQAQQVSDVALQASRTRPEQVQRKYVRPEDRKMTGEEFFPINGVDTNVLTARDGAEITNTYAPNTLYDNLGYEPLSDSVKQYYFGGKMEKANFGSALNSVASAGGGDVASQLITSIGGQNAGGSLGGTIGGTIGSLFGPAGQMIGQVGGQLIGMAFDKNPQKMKKAQDATMANVSAMGLQNAIGGQAQNSSFMKDGGMVDSDYEWVSHSWQPQTITQFGEHKLSDLLKPDETMDTLRAGGHLKEYTPPSEEAMYTGKMAMGGELQTHWGGYAKPISYNPYLPDGGEMVMFEGQSHDESDGKGRTGIGVTYGENPVEVERGEPAVKLQDGGSAENSLHVLGNIKITKGLASLLQNQKIDGKSISGMKFKNAGKLISDKTSKVNKIMENAADSLASMDVSSPFDKLSFNRKTAEIDGGNQKLKTYANQLQDLAMLQNAVNDSKEEKLLNITDDGDIKTAKQGIKIAQDGSKQRLSVGAIAQNDGKLPNVTDEVYYELKDLYDKAKKEGTEKAYLKFQKRYHKLAPEYAKSVLEKNPLTAYGKKQGLTTKDLRSNEEGIPGPRTEQYMTTLENHRWKPLRGEIIPTQRNIPTPKTPDVLKGTPTDIKSETVPIDENKLSLMDYFNQVLPYVRPSNADRLDPNQLLGEMNALATNQLEPVRAQSYQPELGVPYDISYQDILNQNQADYRAQQRLAGNNPAALAILNSQKYQANQKVLGEQFRANQAMKDAVWKENRAILNASKLQNLGIYDQQYVRQEKAKSRTKDVNQAALSSIAAKLQQKQLENRTLQAYENQYNFRYDPRFRAINMNPLQDFQAQIDALPVRDENGNVVEYRTTTKRDKFGNPIGSSSTVTEKSGKKKGKNGFIVKALKSI